MLKLLKGTLRMTDEPIDQSYSELDVGSEAVDSSLQNGGDVGH